MTDASPRLRSIALAVMSTVLVVVGLVAAPPAQAASLTGLRADKVAARGIALTWDKTGEDAYRVRMSTSSKMTSPTTWDVIGNYFEWTRTSANPTSTAARLSPGKTYYFQVKAIKRAATSAERANVTGYSKAIAVKTAASSSYPELAPTELLATTGGSGTVYLSWRTRGPGFTYRLQHRLSGTSSWTSVTFPAAGGKLSGLKAGKKYEFRVRVLSDGKAASGYSKTWTGKAGSSSANPGITVVSYNVRKPTGSPTWTDRRKQVAATIKEQIPDLIALQEATHVTVTVGKNKVRQYQDIIDQLGTHIWAVTSNANTSGTRLAYRKSRFTLVKQGSQKLLEHGTSPRYAVWAVLTDKRTSKKLFVITTHLEPGSNDSSELNDVRSAQARQVLDLIDTHGAGLPVILAGDMNASRSAKPDNGPYQVYADAGLVDALDNATGSWVSGENATAEHLVDAEYNSYNGFERTARRTTYPIGTHVDYILTSPSVRVALWRSAVKLDVKRKFVGTIPSDHNLVSAIVHLR